MEGFGVPVSEFQARGTATLTNYGEPALRTVGHNRGIPAPFSGRPGPEDDERVHCSEVTKKGTPCQAPPAKGTAMCVGHLRSATTKGS